jgi:hypothetical protein
MKAVIISALLVAGCGDAAGNWDGGIDLDTDTDTEIDAGTDSGVDPGVPCPYECVEIGTCNSSGGDMIVFYVCPVGSVCCHDMGDGGAM